MIDLDKNKLAEIPPTILATNATVEIANPIFAVIYNLKSAKVLDQDVFNDMTFWT